MNIALGLALVGLTHSSLSATFKGDGCVFDVPPVIENVIAKSAAGVKPLTKNPREIVGYTFARALQADGKDTCPHGIRIGYGGCCWMCSTGGYGEVPKADAAKFQSDINEMCKNISNKAIREANAKRILECGNCPEMMAFKAIDRELTEARANKPVNFDDRLIHGFPGAKQIPPSVYEIISIAQYAYLTAKPEKTADGSVAPAIKQRIWRAVLAWRKENSWAANAYCAAASVKANVDWSLFQPWPKN